MNRSSKNQYCLSRWNLIMDARVKPAHDERVRAVISTSWPGSSRPSMVNRISKNQYCLSRWNLIMDARVKPAHDVRRNNSS
jgi:hypothetical protein